MSETDYERAAARYCNDDGNPPLNSALEAGDEEAANILLDGGDNPNLIDDLGYNALHWAAMKHCSILLLLKILGKIENVNAQSSCPTRHCYGSTALMLAAGNNYLDIVIELMNHPKINLNVQHPEDNETALHYAVGEDHPAILLQLLSDDRINTSLKDNANWTPLKSAIKYGRDECVDILRNHGAPEE